MFLLNILEGVLAYDLVKIRFMKEKEVILNGNINDKSRGIQLIGPDYLQKVIKGVNWLLSPIMQIQEHFNVLKLNKSIWAYSDASTHDEFWRNSGQCRP